MYKKKAALFGKSSQIRMHGKEKVAQLNIITHRIHFAIDRIIPNNNQNAKSEDMGQSYQKLAKMKSSSQENTSLLMYSYYTSGKPEISMDSFAKRKTRQRNENKSKIQKCFEKSFALISNGVEQAAKLQLFDCGGWDAVTGRL